MSTSLLDHAFGIRGYQHARTEYEHREVIFTIRRQVHSRGCAERRFRSLSIGTRFTIMVMPLPPQRFVSADEDHCADSRSTPTVR